jgi:hypothetical protein
MDMTATHAASTSTSTSAAPSTPPTPPRIVFAITAKNRTQHVTQTLPRNLADNPKSRFVLLNYNDQNGLIDYLKSSHQQSISSGQLVVYTHLAPGAFHVSHAKNMAARLAAREGGDIIVTLDADNFACQNFDQFIANAFTEPGIFLCPNHAAIREIPHGPERPCRGFAGRLAIRTQDFIKAGGYNEVYSTWRGEDIDLNARMIRMGYTMRFIDNRYLDTIPHGAMIRFQEYPAARQYEQLGAWKIPGNENSTVVNAGKWGCGTVYRNFGDTPIELKPIPTRIFGIGLHKTATTSLHKAFQILGFDSLHWGNGEAPKIWNEAQTLGRWGRSPTLERYYAASDLPIPLLYRQLDAAYPGSKFILTLRDEQRWLNAVERLWSPDYNPTRHLWDVYPISNTLHKAVYGRTDFEPATMLGRYRRHNARVKEYFKNRPGDLLAMSMDDSAGWPELCSFLDIDRPNVPYPVECVTRKHSVGWGDNEYS